MNAYDIIKRPVITEQSMESVADKKYVFMVDVNADKTQARKVPPLRHHPNPCYPAVPHFLVAARGLLFGLIHHLRFHLLPLAASKI